MRHLLARLTTTAAIAAGLALAVVTGASSLAAQQGSAGAPQPEPNWKTSPFHGVIGGDGNVIPCRCLFQGREYRVGEKVCMNTHRGVVMTECDLQLNNTSWVPTTEACTIS